MGLKPPKVIGLIGAPACGKSTLSQVVASKLSLAGNNVRLIQEYPRSYIEQHGHPKHISEQLIFFHRWRKTVENAINVGYDYIVCDSPVFVCYIYGTMLCQMPIPSETEMLGDLLQLSIRDSLAYSNVFYIKAGKKFRIDDNLRVGSHKVSESIDNKINSFLTLYKVKHNIIINKNFDDTIANILGYIKPSKLNN